MPEETTRTALEKSPTGIRGFDTITDGGLPRGRPTLVCGAAGCGKTLFGMEFLARGAIEFGEPGVMCTFEETPADLIQNVASLGFDLQQLIDAKKLTIDHIYIEPNEIQETGEYDLEGLFVRLGYAIDSIGAKRIVLDTLEALFGGLSNTGILRAELRRLFRWLKDKGVTAVITGEKGGGGSLTRHGLEEFVSDCVVLLDYTVEESVLTRRIRVVKYRGSTHGTNEYPFLIDRDGISVFPLTALDLRHEVSDKRVSSGIADLDEMLGGGYFQGTTVLISGTAGSGKTSIAVHFADAACTRGERVVYFGFEESAAQLLRNMKSIGFDLNQWVEKGLLHFELSRSIAYGVEKHLVQFHDVVTRFQPAAVILDPATSLLASGTRSQAESMLLRTVDFLKVRGTTALMTSLTKPDGSLEDSRTEVSSVVDSWLLLRDIESNGERNRGLYVLKSRGMAHSNQIREFQLTSNGIKIRRAYLGTNGVLTGSARAAQEAADQLAEFERKQDLQHKQLVLELKRKEIEARIGALQADVTAKNAELERLAGQEESRQLLMSEQHDQMSASRRASGQADRQQLWDSGKPERQQDEQ